MIALMQITENYRIFKINPILVKDKNLKRDILFMKRSTLLFTLITIFFKSRVIL